MKIRYQQISTEMEQMSQYQCEACRNDNRPGRGVLLCKCIRLAAATDDFVIFGFTQCFARIIQLILLGIALAICIKRSLISKKNTEDNQEDDGKVETQNSNALTPATLALMSALIIVSLRDLNLEKYEIILVNRLA